MNTAEILTKAIPVIKTRGWHRGDWTDALTDEDLDTCRVCILAAVNVAAGRLPDAMFNDYDDRAGAVWALVDHLGLSDRLGDDDEISEAVYAIGDYWNDEVATSAEQVISVLSACAAEQDDAEADDAEAVSA